MYAGVPSAAPRGVRANSKTRVLRTPRLLTETVLWILHAFRLAPLVPEQFKIAGRDYVLDTAAIQKKLGWTPQFNDSNMLWQAYERYMAGQV